MNIIGDIAGNYKTLQALLKQMPKGDFISLGDMIDEASRKTGARFYYEEWSSGFR